MTAFESPPFSNRKLVFLFVCCGGGDAGDGTQALHILGNSPALVHNTSPQHKIKPGTCWLI
jgi:hypothetical protein